MLKFKVLLKTSEPAKNSTFGTGLLDGSRRIICQRNNKSKGLDGSSIVGCGAHSAMPEGAELKLGLWDQPVRITFHAALNPIVPLK